MTITVPASFGRSLDFCLHLAKAHAALVRRFDGRLGTLHGVSFSDFILLLQLHRVPGAKLRRVDLAEKLGITASAVTRALIPLERIGLVTRQRDLHDARVGYAVLTRAGQRILQEAMGTAELISEDVIPANGVAQLDRLSELLVQIGG
jgi:DNA-binding MarR family transcriptional regulator